MSRLNGFEKFSLTYQFRCLWSVLIFSILNHPCSFVVCYYLFGVFYLCKVLFSGFLQFKSNFVDGQNISKYRDWAPCLKQFQNLFWLL